MSKAEAFEAKFAGNRSINVEVNFSKGDAIKVPVNINSMDADKLAQNIAEKLDLSSVESKVEEVGNNLLGTNKEATNTKILEETLKVSDAQAQIDQLLAIQLQTIIGE